jgi:hypothetical protein
MSFSPLDSTLLGPLFADSRMREVFSDEALLKAMLRSEAALARAQARLGLVPVELAQAISDVRADDLSLEALGRETAVAGVLTIPFVKAVRASLPEIIREQDGLRGLLLSDPSGSVNAAVNLITPPIAAEADFGLIVIEADYYPAMSRSNLICSVTAAPETGMVPMKEPTTKLCVDTPAGLVYVDVECSGGKCRRAYSAMSSPS